MNRNDAATTPHRTTREVYIGSLTFAAGLPTPIEREISNPETCARLRKSRHGSNTYALHTGEMTDLVVETVQASLDAARLTPSALGAVFLVSSGLDATDNLEPEWLATLGERLGLAHVPHYYVGMTGCGGFHWAMRLATALASSGAVDYALITCFDHGTGPLKRLYGEGSPMEYVTGDAASACLVTTSERAMQYRLVGDVINLFDTRQIRCPTTDNEIETIARLFRETYAVAGIRSADIDYLVTNNYSLSISHLYSQLANVPFVRTMTDTIATHAHCFSSDNVINLVQLAQRANIVSGQRILLFSTGPFQWGACVLERLSTMTGAQA